MYEQNESTPDKFCSEPRLAANQGPAAKPLIRLNKMIADSGYCARRKADAYIAHGLVQVNDRIVTEMGLKINPTIDTVTINGQPLPTNAAAYLLFHKPTDYITSRRGGKTQKTLYELIPKEYQSVDPAGRLDQDSSGALILSNDGDFIYRITHPKFHIPKLYEVTLFQALETEDIQKLKTGVRLLPEKKIAQMSKLDPDSRNPLRYRIELITGFNRQIRRSLAVLGYRVKTLHRISFGQVELDRLPAGECRPLTEREKKALLKPLV